MENEKNFICAGYNVLVLDEDEKLRRDICDALFSFGTTTDEAESADVALALARDHSFDMVFIHEKDIQAASEVLHQILSCCTAGRVVPFMVACTEGDRTKYMEHGFSDVLKLPFEKKDLYDIMSRWIPEERKQYLHTNEGEEQSPELQLASLFMRNVDVISAVKLHGDVGDYIDLLELFGMDGKTRVDSLRQKIVDKDFRNYVIEVHGLKSSAANIGANELSEMAKQHEAAGNEENFSFIEENQDTLFSMYEAVLKEVERVMEKQRPKTERQIGAALSPEELAEKVKAALNAVESFDSKGAAEKVEELLGTELAEDVRKSLEEVQQQLKLYEDEKAEDLLRELSEKL